MRSRVVVTNRAPDRASTAASAARSSTSRSSARWRIAARRLGLDPAELARRNLVRAEQMPYRAAAGAVYDSGDYRALPRRGAASWPATTSCAPSRRAPRADGRLLGIGLACVVEPCVSNMGYITLAQTAEERAAGLPKSGNAEGVTIAMGPHGGVTRAHHDDAAGPGPPHRGGAGRGRRARPRARADRRAHRRRHRRQPVDGLLGQLLEPLRRRSGASAVHLAAEQLWPTRLRALAAPMLGVRDADDVELAEGARPRARRPEARSVLAAPPGRRRALAPERPRRRGRRGARADRHLHAADRAARRRRPRQLVRHATASSPTSRVVRVDPETGEVAVRSYVTVHDAGRLLNPLLADGQIRGGLAHGLGAALLEEHRYDEDGNLHDRDVPRLPAADRDRAAARRSRPPSSRRRRSRRSARRASARATP